MKVTSRKAPNGNAIPFLVNGDDIWLSQRATAALFSTTTQNINQHVYDISKRIDLGHLKQEFTIVQTEGKRDITRSIIHFSFEIVHMVALRAHAWEELDWLVQLSKDLGLLKQHYRVVPKKQRDFGELVQGVMQGITPVIPQFRVGRRVQVQNIGNGIGSKHG